LFTTCSCDEQPYRVANDCEGGSSGGGSGSGTSGPNFPANPQLNDEYEFTDRDGKYSLYKYTLSADGAYYLWALVFTSLPPLTIQSEPENYSFLNIEWPVHNQRLVGTDNFLYTYDAFSGHWQGEATVILLAPSGDIITNIQDYLKCFSQNLGAKVTIFVDQPSPNSRSTWAGSPFNPNVGHTFISIEQGGITRVFGFYPSDGVDPLDPAISSVLVDDSGHSFDVSIEIDVSSSQLTNIINGTIAYNGTYNLNTFNCTDFGILIASLAGVNLPDTNGSWPGGGGSNPGDLGEDIRILTPSSNSTSNTSGGTAQSNSGTCN
jgi:hypothetical protein